MSRFPLRRAQLIAPFGPGAMVVIQDGTSVITGGLDHWYEREDGRNEGQTMDPNEYYIEEWRLQQLLGVTHLKLPPDFRQKAIYEVIPNSELTIPFLRFPRWHFCPKCKSLAELTLSARGKQKCDICSEKKKKSYLVQVPFVAMCDQGHIQDFPWREWVHKTLNPSCRKTMRLIATGGASLAAQKVVCECGAERTLAQITSAHPTDGTTELSSTLTDGGAPYLCTGQRPWLGTTVGEACDRNIRGSLRSAANVYFAEVRSAIYLPRSTASVPSELVELLESASIASLVKLLKSMGKVDVSFLRSQHSQAFLSYSDEQLLSALEIIDNSDTRTETVVEGDDRETAFRRAEFQVLRVARGEDQLMIQEEVIGKYEPFIKDIFARIMLVPRLRETRALAGFTRVFSENEQTPEQKRKLLWRKEPVAEESWLPAYKVYGEGIFLELDEAKLQAWEQRATVIERVKPLVKQYQAIQQNRRLRDRPITPRFLLLHTLSHLLMNRLTFECGYSSAALRERLFVSDNPRGQMAGLLIYTAAGDAEGTLGGLVRMGKAGNFEPVLRRAIEGAQWCSADPVCMEVGSQGGQGPDSCNLAACHNCALVPETACEEFNRFLDRAMVVGELEESGIGFFSSVL